MNLAQYFINRNKHVNREFSSPATALPRPEMNIEASENHVLVRECSNLENYYYLISLSGSQSSIVVAASYAARDPSKKLTKDRAIRALAQIVEKQPALAMVVVRRPSEVRGKDQLWFARLPNLNIEDCIEFIDIEEKDPVENSRGMLERLFDRWFDLTNSSKPLWKVTVVNMNTVYFAFNHIVCDGRSGYFFHREFLSALNNGDNLVETPLSKTFTICQDDWPSVQKETIAKNHGFNIVLFIFAYLVQIIIELICFPKYMVYSDIKRPAHKGSVTKMVPIEDRIKNKIVSIRIDPKTMATLLAQCRSHSTTFTAFFDTLLNTSLCADAYPRAFLTRVSLVVDLRSMCQYPYGELLANMGTSFTKLRRTSPFAAIGTPPKNRGLLEGEVYTDVSAFWKMATYRKNFMNKHLESGAIYESLSISVASRFIDDYVGQVYDTLRTTRNFGSLISNLVVLNPREEDKNREWYFSGTDWASSTVRSIAGPALNICISSTAEAGCVINLGYQEGTYEPEIVPNLAKIMQKRMKQILEDEGADISVRY
ncbi:hypothetical protein ABW20_dc0105613 [Dactylellina cionopaga]|nr:hypothetical protein ABW20_dc0105613 [Dactylellina cionopaga]